MSQCFSQVGLLDPLVLRHLGGCAGGEELAVVQDGDPVGQTEDDVHVVFDHGDRHPTVADLTDDLGEPSTSSAETPAIGSSRSRTAGARSQGHGELELATVAVREVTLRSGPRPGMDPLEERLDARSVRSPLPAGTARRAPTARLDREPDVLAGQAVEQAEVWKDRDRPMRPSRWRAGDVRRVIRPVEDA